MKYTVIIERAGDRASQGSPGLRASELLDTLARNCTSRAYHSVETSRANCWVNLCELNCVRILYSEGSIQAEREWQIKVLW